MKPCYIFDIDGTLADLSHRLHHIKGDAVDWRAFFAACPGDTPIAHIVGLTRILCLEAAIVCVSGRSDEVRKQTREWLRVHKIPTQALYMRRAGDRRPDHIVKGELLDELLGDGWAPIMVFDDRQAVVEMWRSRGIPCAQVAEGNF